MEHLTNLSNRGVDTLSSVSAFSYERVPMSCLDALEAKLDKQCTTELTPVAWKSRPDGTQHSEQHHLTVSMAVSVAHGVSL